MGKILAVDALCRDCEICVLGCSLIHEKTSNPALARLAIEKNMAAYTFHIVICQHCDQPNCLAACPSEALYQDERGVVRFYTERCLNCGLCEEACPYQAIFHDPVTDTTRKCELCAGRPEGPLCVELCPVNALVVAGGIA